MSVKEALEHLKEKMVNDPTGIKGTNAVFQFDLSGEEEGAIQIKFENDQVSVAEGEVDEPRCTLKLSDENFLKLISGKLSPTMAVMTGKVKIQGEMGLAMKLSEILKHYQ